MIFACILPALLLYLLLLVTPALQAFYFSFFKASGFSEQMQWVGLANYRNLWNDSVFWHSLQNMVTILFFGGLGIFGLAFLFTIFLSTGIRGKNFYRAFIFMPNVIAIIAVTTFWSFVFMPRYGLLTNSLKFFGLDAWSGISWTAPSNVFWSMLVGLVWITSGFYTLLVLAGADKVPREIFESARLEGASLLQIFRHVTVPMIWDVIVTSLVLWAIQTIKMMEFPYAFGGPNISQELYTPAIYLYIMGFGQREPVYQLGYATTIGVAILMFTVITVLLLRTLLRRESVEY